MWITNSAEAEIFLVGISSSSETYFSRRRADL